MPPDFLYERIVKGGINCSGTIDEPDGLPTSRFALQGSVYWIHALKILIEVHAINWASMQIFYNSIGRFNAITNTIENTVFEQLLLALHHLSSLKAMSESGRDCDLVRIGIMAWYYGIYCASTAMIAAQDGSQQTDHSGTAKQWATLFSARGLLPSPFNLYLSTCSKSIADAEILQMRSGNQFSLPNFPTNPAEANGAAISYLNGTRGFIEWQVKEQLLSQNSFTNFRGKQAQQLLSQRVGNRQVGFLHMASRFRGKANYRDALFLTYEAQVPTLLNGFISDMERVLLAYLVMAGALCSKRIGLKRWREFTNDLNAHLHLSTMPSDVWQ